MFKKTLSTIMGMQEKDGIFKSLSSHIFITWCILLHIYIYIFLICIFWGFFFFFVLFSFPLSYHRLPDNLFVLRFSGPFNPFGSCRLFVHVEIFRPSQSNGVMSSMVSLPNHTFTG